ncbi:MAG: homocysteine S-methyltransferase family protein [Clostridia bacterium]|nr:homocysteine S-methyltransferase family protein [Clostridia bacterium]
MKTDIRKKLREGFLFLDGGFGTLLQKKGLELGRLPESVNITSPDVVKDIHKSYLLAGADVVTTNTFGANSLKYDNLDEVVCCAVENAKNAVREAGMGEKYIALDIGPLGKVLKPLGYFEFEDAVEVFSQTVKLGVKYGVDLILIETMSNIYELKAALVAAKENSDLPIFASCAYDERLKLMSGSSVETVVAFLEGMGVDALGANCSFGPKQMAEVVEKMLAVSSTPVIACPNAGLPTRRNGETVYDIDAEEFSQYLLSFAKKGVGVLGGCCGTTPEYIERTVEKVRKEKFGYITEKNLTVVTGYADAVNISNKTVLIGERINPTGKKKLKQALKENDVTYILDEALLQQKNGAHILDVNVGIPEIDEVEVLSNTVFEIQSVCELPLQIDTSDPKAMEKAMRIYNGKPLINSVNAKKESMDSIFPLVKKYGGTLIALTLDEKGIPEQPEKRFELALKIIDEAKKYGIDKKDIIVDPLVMTVSSGKTSAVVTLKTVKMLHEAGIRTSLGVSNVSFGLPEREQLNSIFFANAMQLGLDCAILNPMNEKMMDAYASFNALNCRDENFSQYISRFSPKEESDEESGEISELKNAIITGLKKSSVKHARLSLEKNDPIYVIENEIVPALDEVGKGFEKNTVFLPQLLMSAECAKEAFEVVREKMPKNSVSKGTVILATVKGDIHDIGKNIVKVLLENYGFEVIDLGKDVDKKTVVEQIRKTGAELCGLSALMTTTVSSMEETIKLIHDEKLECKVIVGGAVLTKEYAESIGADYYAKDAMESVRYAERVFGK